MTPRHPHHEPPYADLEVHAPDEPVRRPLEDRTGCISTWLGIVVLVMAACTAYAAPSSAPDDSPRPGPSGASHELGADHGAPSVVSVSSGSVEWPRKSSSSASPDSLVLEGAETAGSGDAPLTSGLATWYDAPSRSDAAAGPALRRALGRDWRGSLVRVSRGDRSVVVRLTDWCACGPRNGRPTVIDLDDRAFRELAPLGRGVISVRVEPDRDIPLPETDTP